MILFGALPLILGGVVALIAPRTAASLSPRAAATTLAALALVVALTTGVVLGLLAVLGIAAALPNVSPSDWSTAVIRADSPVPVQVGLAAAALLVVLATNSIRHLTLVAVELRRSSSAAACLPSYGELTIADDAARFAYAVPGRPGRIVVSKGLLQRLSPGQRRAVLAHERSHLRNKHFVYAQAARLAAAANPLLRPTTRVVDTALEQWADEDAVRATGDPRIVAHAIGAASLSNAPVPVPALGAGNSAVVDRVRLLLNPPLHQGRFNALLVAIGLACCVSTGIAALDVHTIIEAAESLA